jgi:predicted PurR-regulated permease PerM/GAF domain-containing protein
MVSDTLGTGGQHANGATWLPIRRRNMPIRPTDRPLTRHGVFETVGTFAIIVALLYLGAGILVPLVLAILLAFALSPLVDLFVRWLRLPEPIAVVLSVLSALLSLGLFAYVAGTQLLQIAGELPAYQTTIANKLNDLQEQFGGGGFLDRITGAVGSLTEQISQPDEDVAEPGRLTSPVPVTIANDVGNPLGVVTALLGTLAGPLATGAIVAIFLVFLLLGRRELQERFIRLVSRGGYSTTTLAMGDASQRVGRYLLLQLGINVGYGVLFGVGLLIIGVPGAILWGLMIMLFRYIPFIGGLLVASLPILLAFSMDAGWGMLLSTVTLFLVIDLTTANVVEPRVYGSSTGVSPIAILLSAMFWATLWGPAGLILATPMTVCLVVIGRHIPQFRVLETLLGSEPVLDPPERLYQRMLRGDTEEAIQIAEEIVEERGIAEFRNQVLLPALRLASSELSDAPESLTQRRALTTSLDAVIEEIREGEIIDGGAIVLVGGRTEIDDSGARVIAQLLSAKGIGSRVLPPMAVRQESIGRIDIEGVEIVYLIYFGSEVKAQTRYVSKRLKSISPGVKVMACMLDDGAGATADSLRVDRLTHDFTDTVDAIESHVDAVSAERSKVGQPFKGAGRGDDALGRALEDVAHAMGVPVATINLLDDERHKDDPDAYRLTETIVQHGVPLVVRSEDGGELTENPYLQSNGVDFYAGVPLTLPTGKTLGSLVIVDYKQHDFTEADVQRLSGFAADLVRRFGTNGTDRR